MLQVVNSVDVETLKLYSINVNYHPLQYNIFVDTTKPKFPPSKLKSTENLDFYLVSMTHIC